MSRKDLAAGSFWPPRNWALYPGPGETPVFLFHIAAKKKKGRYGPALLLYPAARRQPRQKVFTASITAACWSGVISGNSGRDSTVDWCL